MRLQAQVSLSAQLGFRLKQGRRCRRFPRDNHTHFCALYFNCRSDQRRRKPETDRHQASRGTQRAYVTPAAEQTPFTQSAVFTAPLIFTSQETGGCGGVSPPVDSVAASDLVLSPGSNEFSPLTSAYLLSLSDRLSRAELSITSARGLGGDRGGAPGNEGVLGSAEKTTVCNERKAARAEVGGVAWVSVRGRTVPKEVEHRCV